MYVLCTQCAERSSTHVAWTVTWDWLSKPIFWPSNHTSLTTMKRLAAQSNLLNCESLAFLIEPVFDTMKSLVARSNSLFPCLWEPYRQKVCVRHFLHCTSLFSCVNTLTALFRDSVLAWHACLWNSLWKSYIQGNVRYFPRMWSSNFVCEFACGTTDKQSLSGILVSNECQGNSHWHL